MKSYTVLMAATVHTAGVVECDGWRVGISRRLFESGYDVRVEVSGDVRSTANRKRYDLVAEGVYWPSSNPAGVGEKLARGAVIGAGEHQRHVDTSRSFVAWQVAREGVRVEVRRA